VTEPSWRHPADREDGAPGRADVTIVVAGESSLRRRERLGEVLRMGARHGDDG
jgi:hypothetical protein